MSKRNNEGQKSSLALAMAVGDTVADWASEKHVALRTAQAWSASREVRKEVRRIRRRVLDAAIGRLSKNATAAADRIAQLVKDAKSEAVQFSAARAVLADLMAVSNYAALERRLAAVERRMQDTAESPISGCPPEQTVSPDDGELRKGDEPCPAC